MGNAQFVHKQTLLLKFFLFNVSLHLKPYEQLYVCVSFWKPWHIIVSYPSAKGAQQQVAQWRL